MKIDIFDYIKDNDNIKKLLFVNINFYLNKNITDIFNSKLENKLYVLQRNLNDKGNSKKSLL